MDIGISAWASCSALGADQATCRESYRQERHCLSWSVEQQQWVGRHQAAIDHDLQQIAQEKRSYHRLDKTVLMAMLTAQKACRAADWTDGNFGINIGSSRGATAFWEQAHQKFDQRELISPLTSPNTTLGNISSWVGQYLKHKGMAFSHSVTCSTALHAFLNGMSWIKAGWADRFLVGGSEAPLTPFTIAQMKALRIYADAGPSDYPCRAGDLEKTRNSMVLGEGAACFCLEKASEGSPFLIEGVGYAVEQIRHAVDLSEQGDGLFETMRMAIGELDASLVDVVVTHMPGTIKGDQAEWRALERLFGPDMPLITNNKWKIGHCLGASGALNVELALFLLEDTMFIPVPYLHQTPKDKTIKRVLVNAVGFGGNAVSLLISRNPAYWSSRTQRQASASVFGI
ncbi:MAG: beta-ketoacyl synthase N-terminal-like domain-containing protein [Bacteroidota bacterium]